MVRRPQRRITRRLPALIAIFLLIGTAAPLPGQTEEASSPPAPSSDQVERGMELFEGRARFENGGPSCNACHDVTHRSVVGGGSLAADLTGSFSRMGGTPGLGILLKTPPFPVMQQAFAERPLTEEEISALVAFLQQADAEEGAHTPIRYGWWHFGVGLGGAVLLIGLFSVTWRSRRRVSVNHEIYERQLESI